MSKELKRLNGVYANLLTSAGVKIFEGRAVFVDAHTVGTNPSSLLRFSSHSL